MPRDYNKSDLSKKQKAGFIVVAVLSGGILGKLFFDSYKVSVIIAICFFAIYPMYREKVKEKRKQELLVQFRDMLYSISSSISSGRNMQTAIHESIDFWKSTYDDSDYIMQELKYMDRRMKSGNETDIVVLKDFANRSGLEDVEDFVNVYENSKKTGGDLAGAIERATTIIGDKISLENELKTMMSQKLFEGRIVASAPFLVVLALRLTASDYLEPMLESSKGIAIMGLALFLMAVALVMIERINKIEI